MKSNKAGALRTNLERTDGRHPDSPAAAGALGLGPRVPVRGTLIRSSPPSATGSLPTTRSEAVGNLCDRNHGRVAVVHRFTIDVTDAETALEFGDGPK
jgi:hypothetical protein